MRLDPLITNEFQLRPVVFAGPVGAFFAGADQLAEKGFGVGFDGIALCAEGETGSEHIVLIAGEAKGFEAGVLTNKLSEIAVKDPDWLIRNGWRRAMAFQGVLEIAEFGGPFQMGVECEGDVLSDFGGLVGVHVSIGIGLLGDFRVEGFRLPDWGHGWKYVRLLQHVGALSPNRPGSHAGVHSRADLQCV